MTAPPIPQTEPHVRALQQILTATGLAVGIGVAPDNTAAPYVVLYADPGMLEGSVGNPNETLLVTFQISAVGVGGEQALQQADRARAALLAGPPTVPGRSVQPLWLLDSQPVRRDDQVQPPLFVATAQYRMRSDPA